MNLRRTRVGCSTWIALVLGACGAVPPDDGVAETSSGASEGESETEGASSTGANGPTSTTAPETSSSSETGEHESSTSPQEETGPTEETGPAEDTGPHDTGSEGPVIPLECEDLVCDGATEYCYENIFDGPSEFSCEPIPLRCADDPTCDCIVPIDCPESKQSCEPVEGGIRLECVTG